MLNLPAGEGAAPVELATAARRQGGKLKGKAQGHEGQEPKVKTPRPASGDRRKLFSARLPGKPYSVLLGIGSPLVGRHFFMVLQLACAEADDLTTSAPHGGYFRRSCTCAEPLASAR
jgi:hypothetical protein